MNSMSKEEYRADLVKEHVGYGFTLREAEAIADIALVAANAAGDTITNTVETLSVVGEQAETCMLYATRAAYRLLHARAEMAIPEIENILSGETAVEVFLAEVEALPPEGKLN